MKNVSAVAMALGILLGSSLVHARRPPAPPPPDPALVRAEMAHARAEEAVKALGPRFEAEPSVRAVQAWCIGTAALGPERTRRLLLDGQRAGGLPWIRLRGRFQDADKKDYDEVALMDGRRKEATWTAELWLEWDLADAVAGPARFRAAKEARSQVELRQAIAHEATVAYFDRRRLLTEEALDVVEHEDLTSLARRQERRLRIEELDGLLDALTSRRWGRALAQLEEVELPPVGPVGPAANEPSRGLAEW
jgi:hypothetical protein